MVIRCQKWFLSVLSCAISGLKPHNMCLKYSGTCLERVPHWAQKMVSQDRWPLMTDSFTLKCRTFCQKLVVLQDRWSLIAVVSQDRFHCMFNILHDESLIIVIHTGRLSMITLTYNSCVVFSQTVPAISDRRTHCVCDGHPICQVSPAGCPHSPPPPGSPPSASLTTAGKETVAGGNAGGQCWSPASPGSKERGGNRCTGFLGCGS